MGDAHQLAAGQAAETQLGKVGQELGPHRGALAMRVVAMVIILSGFSWAPASLERGLPLLPQGACGHLSLWH